MTIIESMHRFGSIYHVRTACGHHFQATKAEVSERQLFIGKRIDCKMCTRD